jgi:tetratricopeptide (TPR) repeat protein
MAKNVAIEQLPDYPAIKQIQGALWGIGETRGAAVFVGAGFSRNAVLPAPNSPKPPLWSDFSRIMGERLYQGSKDATSDPLRLAQEYKATLGSTALDSLIYDLVRDEEWLPGQLHSRLVSLPWTDILTTNWDTLLERAARVTDREETYDAVTTIGDIPRTRSPRIVKVHGSMPSNLPFIFTEEDYRTYPRDFAPFVNLVQQVLMENELCLIGFSGDDPNFLQWSGWIRDQLGDSARRIYLVGVLNMAPSHRKYLEARKVIPIDLAPTVDEADAEERHSMASGLFLDFLHNSRPKPAWQWLSKAGSIRSQQLLAMSINQSESTALVVGFKELISDWRREREVYPGWLVCPSTDRTRLRDEIGNAEHLLRRAWEHLQNSERAAALYEMVWRLDLAFFPLSEWFRGVLADTVENSSSALNRQQRLEIARILLRVSREERSPPLFDRCIAFLKTNAGSDADVVAAIAYEQSLWARDQLDYPALVRLVPTIIGDDPAWKIRRAALHYELGEFDKATALVIESREEIRERLFRDRKSIWNISRLAWTQFVARAARLNSLQSQNDDPLDTSNERYARNKCLPWDELDELDRKVAEEFRERMEGMQHERPGFEAGTYRETVRLFSSSGWAVHDTQRLTDIIGLPTAVGSMDVMRSRFSRAIELASSYDELGMMRAIRILGGSSDKSIENIFSRIAVARMPVATIEKLLDVLWRAIEFGRTRFGTSSSIPQHGHGNFWVERVGILVEVLSRLVVRLNGERAIEMFRKAVSLAHAPDWAYWVLFEPLGNLLSRALLAVPPRERRGLLLEIVNLPLPDERGIHGQGGRGPLDEWPELMGSFPDRIGGRGSNEIRFAARVATLVSKIMNGDPLTRERAALRLACLQQRSSLTPQESISFGQALWSKRESESALPQHTNLAPHVLFDIPGHDNEDLLLLFRHHVVDKALSGLVSPDPLREIVAASRKKSDGSRAFELTRDEALRLFDLVLDWKPRPVAIDLDRSNAKMADLFGRVLVEAILPVVDLNSLGQDRIDKLFHKVEAGPLNSGVIALADIVRLDPSRENRAIELIYRSAFNRDRDTVIFGLRAIDRWRILSKGESHGQMPQQLRQTTMTLVTGAREPWLSSALYLAGKLLEDGNLGEGDKQELVLALDRLRTETAYSSWETSDTRTMNITHVRARCVKLADMLRKAGVANEAVTFWIDHAKDDPVPEVRYVLDELED